MSRLAGTIPVRSPRGSASPFWPLLATRRHRDRGNRWGRGSVWGSGRFPDLQVGTAWASAKSVAKPMN